MTSLEALNGIPWLRWTAKLVAGAVALSLLAAGLHGCSEQAVQPGDHVRVDYTCRLAGGGVVATTVAGIAGDPGEPKSPLFDPLARHEAVVLQAGQSAAAAAPAGPEALETVLIRKISDAVLGMKVRETRKVRISGAVTPGLEGEDRFVQMARIRWRPKEKTMTRDYFLRFSKGKEPAPGAQVVLERGFAGRVSSVDGENVTLAVSPIGAGEVDTEFGRGVVRDAGDHYEVELQVEPGRLVRVGPLAGHVSEVGAETFTLDFGDPFGGEALECQVHVTGIEARAASEAKGKAAGAGENAAGGGARPKAAAQPGDSASTRVEEGDVATVDYTVRLESDEVVRTTLESVHRDPRARKSAFYEEPKRFGPEQIWVGREASLLNLGPSLLGMRTGEERSVELSPEDAYGVRDPKRVLQFRLVRRNPRVQRLGIEAFARMFGSLPKKGASVKLAPYFETWVVQSDLEGATLESVAKPGERFEESFGTTEVSVEGDEIVTRLTPKIGAAFEYDGRTGRILSADAENFTVDFNHPLAGERLTVNLEVVTLAKGATLEKAELPWLEDFAQGLEAARTTGKPFVLVLYAHWCPHSRRLLAETLEDPRVKMLADRFVWAKVDSDEDRSLLEMYRQESFPTTLVLDPAGEVLTRLEGFQSARALTEELGRVSVAPGGPS